WFGVRAFGIDIIANAHAGIAALEAVQPNDIETFVLGIRRQHDRGRVALARDLYDLAFAQIERLERLTADTRRARADILRLGTGNLQPGSLCLSGFRHVVPCSIAARQGWQYSCSLLSGL